MEKNEYCKELDVAVKAVHLACALCRRIQQGLVSDHVLSKDDDSLVTLAETDFSVQATISWLLSESFVEENISIVAEEDTHTISKPESSRWMNDVVVAVNECLAEAPRCGLQGPSKPLSIEQVLEAINRCSSKGGPFGRYWVLDPVDGTLGFVRGDQYAVALALIEDGQVVLGVLGCPNYPLKKEGLNYNSQPTLPESMPTTSNSIGKGCILYALRGSSKAWMQPLIYRGNVLEWENNAVQISVSSINDPTLATLCEPVEKGNSSHSFTAVLAESVGLRKKPLRVHSMVKYAAIARGDAEIFMKFARAGYKEKTWDHAAGVLIVQEAGGVVTDAGGRPLNFSRGIYLENLDRGIIACSGASLHEKVIGAVYASWEDVEDTSRNKDCV